MTENTNDPQQETEQEAVIGEVQPEDGQLQIVEDVLPSTLTVLPLKQRPIFPGITLPLTFAGKEKIEVLKNALEKEDGYLGLVLAREYAEEDYSESELYEMGTAFKIMRIAPIGPNTVQVLGQGVSRFSKKKVLLVKPTMRWEVTYHRNPKEKPEADLKAYMMAISSEIKELLQLNPLFQEQVNMVVAQLNIEAPGRTMDVISNLLTSDGEKLQELLETLDLE
jgi:ATP-dependent Lon protease